MAIDVQHLAKLARLRIEDAELAKFEKDMESIVAMVEQLPEVSGDASGLDPDHPMKARTSSRVTSFWATLPKCRQGALSYQKRWSKTRRCGNAVKCASTKRNVMAAH